jgi:ubiquinone/menaquinone biosynthesis C-methylase UbiE
MPDETDLGRDDPFRSLDAAGAASWIEALELRAATPMQVALRHRAIELARLGPGARVAEVGCGTGALLAALARAVGPAGRVLGVEPLEPFVEAARARLRREGLDDVATAVVGDDAALEARGLDACFCQTVLIHVPVDRRAAFLRRVVAAVRPGGRVVTIDQDGDTWTIDHPQRELTRRIVRYNSDQRYGDGWTGRSLHRLLAEAGCTGTQVLVEVQVDRERDSYLFGMAERIAGAARAAGVLTTAEHEGWVSELQASAMRGFFSSINSYLAVGVVPAPGKTDDCGTPDSRP